MSDNYKDHLSNFHDYGIYYPTKTIELFGEVDDGMHNKFIRNMHILNNVTGNIKILIDSVGGDVHKAMAMYDSIKNSKNYVEAAVIGEAASSAAWILQAADHRKIYQNSSILLHIGEVGYPSAHPCNHKEWDRYNTEIVEKWMYDVMLKKIKQKKKRFTKDKLTQLLLFDKILTPKEALEYNLIDEIVQGD